MILKGSQRGGALKLASHLLNMVENDHVEVHELRGFSSDDLRSALRETDAIAKGTRCYQFLFSVSFSPPDTEQVSAAQFEAAIAKVEQKLRLTGQARAIVFHEKEGRRHAHAVWSRIDVASMTAINMDFFKSKLKDISKGLFLEHGWRLPEGFRDRTQRNPLNFTIAEWQQAKRMKQDAQALKMTFRECWAISDNRASFERALEEQGFLLTRGDRRTYLAMDFRGEVYSLSRYCGQKKKALAEKLGDPDRLPRVEQVKEAIAAGMTDKLQGFIHEAEFRAETDLLKQQERKAALKTKQRSKREELRERQTKRADREAIKRAARFRKGLGGLWDWLSGKSGQIRKQNELEAEQVRIRDAREREMLISSQLSERRLLQQDLRQSKRDGDRQSEELRKDVAYYLGLCERPGSDGPRKPRRKRTHKASHDLGL